MYSEAFMNYLIRYQNEDFEIQEKKEESLKPLYLGDVKAERYITVPIKHETF